MSASPLNNHYRVIYADPPWTFSTYSRKGKGRSAEAYYDCLSLEEIKAVPGASLTRPSVFIGQSSNDRQRTTNIPIRVSSAAWGFGREQTQNYAYWQREVTRIAATPMCRNW